MNIIFLDIDGVLNCQIFYTARKAKRASTRKKDIDWPEYYRGQICSERISWLNELCEKVNAKVVISASMRSQGLEHVTAVLQASGATFDIIDITPDLRSEHCFRGNEIYKWIKDNSEKLYGIPYYEFKSYVIIDDDSDMLLWQQPHFFQTDTYSGLTPTTCYKIGRFFGCPTFKN